MEGPQQSLGRLDFDIECHDSQQLMERLTRFQQSDEIPTDAREGMILLIGWWKLNRYGITAYQSHEFNRTVQGFIRSQLGLTTSPDCHQQFNTVRLLTQSKSSLPAPDLAPEMYSTKQLSGKLHASEDTLKRYADKACQRGRLPQPLPYFPNWFVVRRAHPLGGKNRGWKYQQLRDAIGP